MKNAEINKDVKAACKKKRFLSDLECFQDKQIFESANQCFLQLSAKIPTASDYKIKILRNKSHWHQQIFTYVILFLCYQSKQSSKYSLSLIDALYELIEKEEFQFIVPQTESQLMGYSQLNLKNILSQFLNLMNEKKYSVLKSLSKYPLMMEIFVLFLRTLIYLGDQCSSYQEQLQMNKTYDFLASYFQIQILMTENYVYFTDANIYAVKLTSNQVFMLIPSTYQYSICFNDRQVFHTQKSGISSVQVLMQSEQKKLKELESSKRKKVKISFEKKNKKLCFEESINSQLQYVELSDYEKQNRNRQFCYKSVNYTESQIIQQVFTKSLHKQKKENILQQCTLYLSNRRKQNQQVNHYRNKSQIGSCLEGQMEIIQELKENIKKGDKQEVKSMQSEMEEKEKLEKRRPCLKQGSSSIKRERCEGLPGWIMNKLQMLSKVQQVDHHSSKQFTNSVILEQMQQPFKSSIRSIKQRSRLIKRCRSIISKPN